MEFSHVSVLLDECIDGLKIKEDGIYVDGTLGGGGHSLEIVKRLGEKGRLIDDAGRKDRVGHGCGIGRTNFHADDHGFPDGVQ